MKQGFKRRSSAIVMLAGMLGGIGAAGSAYACSSEPYIGSVCIMAWPKNAGFGGGMYAFANGATLSINNNAALFSVIGISYGGNGQTNFQLPDLQGRVIVGAGSGQGLPTYIAGNKGGTAAITLTSSQLPPHTHTLVTGTGGVIVNVGPGTLAAQTTLTGLTATTTMTGVTGSINGSALTLNGSSGGNFGTNPSGASLGTYAGTQKIYSDAAPTVSMKAGAISGTAAVTFGGTPTTTISGNPTTTLTGTQSVAIGGNTGITGSGLPFSIMPPYLAMTYYIAINGLYPSQD